MPPFLRLTSIWSPNVFLIGKAVHPIRLTFLNEILIDVGIPAQLKLESSFAAVKGTRMKSKQSMKLNYARPK